MRLALYRRVSVLAHRLNGLWLVVLLVASSAGAQTNTPSDARRSEPRFGRMALQVGGVTALMAGWYWTHLDLSREDLELGWDWPSWEHKLKVHESLRFDSNGFYINAVSHPFAGVFEYQAARANGFGLLGSSVISFAGAAVWEYLIEYRERPSLNDLVVNTVIGVGAAEPLVQIGRALRTAPSSTLRRSLAFILSPFDSVNGWVDRRQLTLDRPPWLRTRVFTGGRVARVTDEHRRAEGSFGLDFELVNQPGYGRPGARSGRVRPGARSRIEATFDFADQAGGVVGARVATRTTYFGRHTQDIGLGRRGWGRFLGLGTGFEFEIRRLTREVDRLAAAHLVGPELQLESFHGPATIRWDLRVYGDLAMVQAHVFGPTPPFEPMSPPTSSLQADGYYFGYGGTLASRLRLAVGRVDAEVGIRGHLYTSIDGLDRREMGGGRNDPHGVADQRGHAHLQLGVELTPGGIGLATSAEVALRRGTWTSFERDTMDARVGLFLFASP
jgi:hypothetical protein